MESEPWSNLVSSSSSRRLRSRSEKYGDAPDGGGEAEDAISEYACPYCAEDFDILGLYCHMDEEHPVAVKTGVCPVCTKKVGHEIVAHITGQHGNLFKAQRKRRHRKGGFSSTILGLRNELREGHHGGSSRTSLPETDILLSSFVFNPVDTATNSEPGKELGRNSSKRKTPKPKLEDQKCGFVQQLMSSIILDDGL